jgi:hypothetical protein
VKNKVAMRNVSLCISSVAITFLVLTTCPVHGKWTDRNRWNRPGKLVPEGTINL